MSAPATLETLLARLRPGGRARAAGLTGAARGWVLARAARRLSVPLVALTADEESADHLASDLAFFLGGEGTREAPTVLRLPADEVLPWDELLPDAGAVAERLSTLYHLEHGTPFSAVVLSARALAKKVLPPKVMRSLSSEIHVGDERGRDELAKRLVEDGFRSAPLVEDPGTFSLRGDLLDVFPALSEYPVRLEFFGDTLESMRTFDPDTQRTVAPVKRVTLLPARELFLSPSTQRAAEAAIRAAGETQAVPTSKVRERLSQVKEGLSPNGLEGLLPGFFEGGLASVFEYLERLPAAPLFWVDDPTAVERALSELEADLERSFEDAVRRSELTLPPPEHYLSREEAERGLARFMVLEGGGLTLDALEPVRISPDRARPPSREPPEEEARRDTPLVSQGLPTTAGDADRRSGDGRGYLHRLSGEEAPLRFDFGRTAVLREAIRSHHGEDGALTPLLEKLTAFRDEGTVALVACGTLGQADRLKRLLAERGARVQVHPDGVGEARALFDPSIAAHLFAGEVTEGFIDAGEHVAVLSDEDIFGARARRKVRRRKTAAEGMAASFKDLKEGDLCVHADFGVCRYAGLVTMDVNQVPGDFLVLEFFGKDKVYLPVSRLRLVSRFAGGDPEKVSLDRLGTPGWAKKKAQVKEQLLKMAAELLELYARRKAHHGHAFSEPDRYFRQFEADFEFEETPDQQKAIDDVLADMQKKEPMDRLVCGDVGYGKTEVAMRAAFKAVLDRKQVAVLVPTTLLAHQHLATFKERFEGYPVTVDVVSGLRKPNEVRETQAKAREGRVDVVIGTHKLLNAAVGFKDLGLLIIDEEQKFGVKQKEALKRLKTTVDTLTLSATPIPRTLNMAMSGMRDLSLIATPPQDRRAIRTFVTKFDTAVIKEAVTRELSRGGQVFVVHNRVQSIHSFEKLLKELLPGVSITVAHGQMHEGQLEKVMLDFVEKRTQVLLSTAIIESGLDIPSANTLIVNRADQFGLGQLYQLRGRVGRAKERAYAYLLVPQGKAIGKDAARRLEVLQAFTELGAGFNIASHDLEIRGAGSLLGGEQSGSIDAVGFDLYAQMLEEAIGELKGEPPSTGVEPDVNLPVPAYLPEAFVPDVHLRLVLYKRLSACQSADELADLRAELVDRFGDAPPELDALEEVLLLKLDLRRLNLRELSGGPGRVVVTMGPQARLSGEKLMKLVQRSRGHYKLTPDLKLVAKVDASVKGEAFIPAARKVMRDLLGCEAAS